MIDFVEELLVEWGQEQYNPTTESSIRSPLGHVGEPGARAAGSRCLSLVEQYAACNRRVLVVEQALRDISSDCGASGQQMAALADMRYARRQRLPVIQQQRLLGMSRDVYRARLERLHVEVAARWPELDQLLGQLAGSTPAAQSRIAWADKVRRASQAAKKARAARVDAEARRRRRWLQRNSIRRLDAVYRSSGWFQRSRSIQGVFSERSGSGVFHRFTPCPLE